MLFSAVHLHVTEFDGFVATRGRVLLEEDEALETNEENYF